MTIILAGGNGFIGSKIIFDGIKKTVRWHLDNRDWWEEIISGKHQNYYERIYGGRR